MYIVIGGGVVGLHVAIALASQKGHPEIFVLEKEKFLGDHTSGRNSEVIHAGFAYPIGSNKAKWCVEGNKLTSKSRIKIVESGWWPLTKKRSQHSREP